MEDMRSLYHSLFQVANILQTFTLTVIGDKVTARIYNITRFASFVVKTNNECSTYSKADLVKVVEPSLSRYDSLVNCRYFGKCAGCQLQMMKYEVILPSKG